MILLCSVLHLTEEGKKSKSLREAILCQCEILVPWIYSFNITKLKRPSLLLCSRFFGRQVQLVGLRL